MSLAGTASTDTRAADLSRPEFWRAHFPDLSINTRLASANVAQIEPAEPVRELWRARMAEEGYFQGASATLRELAPQLGAAAGRAGEKPALAGVGPHGRLIRSTRARALGSRRCTGGFRQRLPIRRPVRAITKGWPCLVVGLQAIKEGACVDRL